MKSARYHTPSLSRLRFYLRPVLLPGVTVALVLLANTGTSQAGHWELDHYVRSASRRVDDQSYGAGNHYHRDIEPADGSGTRNEIIGRDNQGQLPPPSIGAEVSCRQVDVYGGLGLPPYHYQAGHGFCELTVQAVFKWHRDQIAHGDGEATDDPNDNPPARLYLRETGISHCALTHSNGAEWPDTINSIENPYMGQGFTVENLRNGLRDAAQVQPRPIYYGATTGDYSTYVQGADATHFTVLAVGGSDTVNGPTRTLGGTVTAQPWTFTNGKEYASAQFSFWYQVEIEDFTIWANIPKGSPLSSRPDYQVWNGYLKQDYKLNDPALPLQPFWVGVGSYEAAAKDSNGHNLFADPQYRWTISGSGQPYLPAPHTADEASHFLPAESTPAKEFHLDFGTSNAGFPTTSTVLATVTGPDADSPVLWGKVDVHWYLPRWFVTVPTPVTTVTGEHDPDKPTGPVNPDNDPNSNEYAAMQTIALYLTTQQQFVQTGATYIENALKVEEAIAEFYATGPLFELGAGALELVIGKAGEALEQVRTLRAFASKAAEEAANLRRVAEEGRQAGKSAEDIVKAEETAAQLEQKGAAAEEKATELELKFCKTGFWVHLGCSRGPGTPTSTSASADFGYT